MPKLTEENTQIIKDQIRRYIALKGGRRVTNIELAEHLQRDQEFIAELRKEILEEDLEPFDKKNIRHILAGTRGALLSIRSELGKIAYQEDGSASIREKLTAIKELKSSYFSEFELYQSVGVCPRVISDEELKDPNLKQINVIALLDDIISVVDEDNKRNIIQVVKDYADMFNSDSPIIPPVIPAIAS